MTHSLFIFRLGHERGLTIVTSVEQSMAVRRTSPECRIATLTRSLFKSLLKEPPLFNWAIKTPNIFGIFNSEFNSLPLRSKIIICIRRKFKGLSLRCFMLHQQMTWYRLPINCLFLRSLCYTNKWLGTDYLIIACLLVLCAILTNDLYRLPIKCVNLDK